MKTPIFTFFLILFFSFNINSQINDFENCEENYEAILCDPLVIDTINSSALYSTAVVFSTIGASDVEWEFGFAVHDNNDFYYYQKLFAIINSEVLSVHAFYDCENLVIVGLCVLGSDEIADGCYDGNNSTWAFTENDFNLIPISDFGSYAECTNPVPFDQICDPCGGSDCIDLSLINESIQCPQEYDPVCGCDGKTYSNGCIARFGHGVIDWTSGACSSSDCIDENQIDDNIICPGNYAPVCGCDGKTYNNSCIAENYFGIIDWTDGGCPISECIDTALINDLPCPQLYAPVCGCDGVTYPNECFAVGSGVISWTLGPCSEEEECFDPDLVDEDIVCPQVFEPVCGCDGITYGNECLAQSAGVINYQMGDCNGIGCDSFEFAPLPILGAPDSQIAIDACSQFGNNPVCGCDGITYQNSCFAYYNGVEYTEEGECGTQPCMGPTLDIECPLVIEPVCGCDGENYNNDCEALKAGIQEWTLGECDEGCTLDPNTSYVTTNITQTSARLNVLGAPANSEYKWEFRLLGGSNWFSLGTTSNSSLNISQLEICTNYEWRVEVICSNEVSAGYSSIVEFKTTCIEDCILSSTIDYSTSNIMETSAKLNVVDGPPNASYRWELRKFENDIWSLIGLSTEPSLNIGLLSICDSYQWRVRITCENGVIAGYSDVISFTTICPCFNPDLIDPNIQCPQNYDPVCGCDGKSYANSCIAESKFGLTDWTIGACNTSDCIDPSLIDQNIDCPQVYTPVCGCDGRTYNNACIAEYYFGIIDWTEGVCGGNECIDIALINDLPCPQVFEPVCGCDGITYPNECYAVNSGVITWALGPCDADDECVNPDLVEDNSICPLFYEPVCGCDGITYPNECHAQSAGVIHYQPGECNGLSCDGFEFAPLPVIAAPDTPTAINACSQYGDQPVCGCDGITYQNSCFAYYNGVEYYEDGECGEQPCTGPKSENECPAVIEFVCGCDGVTYNNSCEALKAGIQDWTNGECIETCELDQDPFIDIRNNMETSVDLVVEGLSDDFSLLVKYRLVGDLEFTIFIPSENTSIISNLMICSSYECVVEVYCENGLLGYVSELITFGTTCSGCIFNDEATYATVNITETTADFEIDLLSTDYSTLIWSLRKIDGEWFSVGATQSTGISLNSLDECTDYQWKVEMYCSDDTEYGGSSPITEFTTECINSVIDRNKATLEIFPSPSNNVVNIISELPIVKYEVYDISGTLMVSNEKIIDKKKRENFSVRNLQSGLYLLHVYYSDEKFEIQRFAVY